MIDLARIQRRATLAGVTGLASRAVSFVTLFAAIPFVLAGAGNERFGLWMLVTSLVTSLGFLDLGFANGMLTALAHASGETGARRRAEIIATGLAMLCAIAVAFLAIGLALVHVVPWHDVLNVSPSIGADELDAALTVLVVAVALGVVSGSAQKIYFGLHLGAQANLWQAVGAAAAFACLIAAARFAPTLPSLVAAALLPPALAWLAGMVVLFRRLLPELRPERAHVSRVLGRELGRDGALFFALQASAAIAIYSDNLVLAAALGTGDLAAYSIVARVFGAVNLVISIMAYPLWASFGAAAAAGETHWIASQLRRSLLLTLAFAGGGALLLALAFEPLVAFWLREHAPVFPPGLVIAFAVWTILNAIGAVVSSLLNALKIVRLQLAIAAVFTPVCLWLKWEFAHLLGPAGIAWAGAGSYLVIALVPYFAVVGSRFAALRSAATTPTALSADRSSNQ